MPASSSMFDIDNLFSPAPSRAPAPTSIRWLTLGSAASRLGVSRSVVRKLVLDGKLTCRRVGAWSRVPEAEILALIERSTRHAIKS